MKTILNVKELQNTLKEINKVKKNKDIPITENIIITARDEQTIIEKDNGFTRISKKIDSNILEDGVIALQESTIKIISKLPNNDIEFNSEKILSGTKQIKYTNKEYIEKSDLINCKEKFNVSEKELLRLLEVSYCRAEDETRPILKGVCFKNNKLCALDGYRMSVRTTQEFNIDSEFVINYDSIDVLKSVLNKKSDDIVSVEIYENCAVFNLKDTQIQCRFLDGNYINYENLIPQGVEEMTTIQIKDTEEIKKSLDILKGIKNSKNTTILKLTENEKNLMLSASNEENEVSDIMQESGYVKYNKNNDTEIWLNCRYLIDMLKTVQADTLYMSFRNNVSPMIVYKNDNLENFELILPVRQN